MRADLHICTTASDGRWLPDQVVAELKTRSIGLFAVTDHDTLGAVRQSEALACDAGLAFLRGVEVSAEFGGRLVHILAHDPDLDSKALIALLRHNELEMAKYDEHIIGQLIAAGYEIDREDYAGYTYEPTRGGWKSLNFLIDEGLCTGPRDFDSNLLPGVPECQIGFPYPSLVIALIRESGVCPSWPIPAALCLGASRTRHCGLSWSSALRDCSAIGLSTTTRRHAFASSGAFGTT